VEKKLAKEISQGRIAGPFAIVTLGPTFKIITMASSIDE
jgi:hypothetical protein